MADIAIRSAFWLKVSIPSMDRRLIAQMATWMRSNHIRMAGASEGLALNFVLCGALRQKVGAGLWRAQEEFVPVLVTGEVMRPMSFAPRVTFLTFSNRRISAGS